MSKQRWEAITNAQRWSEERVRLEPPVHPAKGVFKGLLSEALGRTLLCSSDRESVRRALRDGTGIPEKSLPGRLVMKLRPEERLLLRDFRGEMTLYVQSGRSFVMKDKTDGGRYLRMFLWFVLIAWITCYSTYVYMRESITGKPLSGRITSEPHPATMKCECRCKAIPK